MGQVRLRQGRGTRHAASRLVPGDITGLQPGQQRYTQLTNETGGILDDLMVTSTGDTPADGVQRRLQGHDLAHGDSPRRRCEIEPMFSRGLLALQGPGPRRCWRGWQPRVAAMKFMTALRRPSTARAATSRARATPARTASRSRPPSDAADAIARKLLAEPEGQADRPGRARHAAPRGRPLLYGNDIDETDADRGGARLWIVGKAATGRRPGAARIQKQIAEGAPRRVGFEMRGQGVAREGAQIAIDGKEVGVVTSSGFPRPRSASAIAMGYVEPPGCRQRAPRSILMVRGKPRPAEIAAMPFVKHSYYRGRS